MNKIRIGVVGVGFISDFHIAGFSHANGAELVGITRDYYGDKAQQDRSRQKLLAKAEHYGIRVYENFDAIVTSDDIDALIITSINPLHFSQICQAIECGKHILVEKPIVTDIEHYQQIQRLSQDYQVKVFPAHNFVYRGAVRHAKKILESGELGQLVHASFVVTHGISAEHAAGWRGVKSLSSGGALMDSGHHIVYQALYLFGLPNCLQAFTSKIHHNDMECEDTASINMQYDSGLHVSLMQSWASRVDEGINGIRILGEKGNIIITDALYHNSVKLDDDLSYENSFRNQAQAFVDFIREDVSPLSTLQDAKDTLHLIHLAYESARGKEVFSCANTSF